MKVKILIFSLFFILFHLLGISVFAGDVVYRVYFPVGRSTVDLSYKDNKPSLDSLLSYIGEMREKKNIFRVVIEAGASPEGGTKLNKSLSDRRCESLRSYIQQRLSLPDSIFSLVSLGQDWHGLDSLVEDSEMPYREEALRIIRNTPEWVIRGGVVVDSRKRRLMNLHAGRVWHYMSEHFFPSLRNSTVVRCELKTVPVKLSQEEKNIVSAEVKEIQKEGAQAGELAADTTVSMIPSASPVLRDTVERTVAICDTVMLGALVPNLSKPFYMGLKTNLLYDALLVPNIGLEFYLGGGWSVGGNWMYAWWDNDSRHRYWRVYGGEIDVRRYFGQRTAKKPLTGHHVGVYGQMITYDFEAGGRGYIGGRPGGTLWEKAHYGAGVEYGYSFPVGKRLNLDLSIGLGYLGGVYYEYIPSGGHYVWERTRHRHWFGPTKAEVSLVWLLGRGNYNKKKGGTR